MICIILLIPSLVLYLLQFKMRQEKSCTVACKTHKLDAKAAKNFREKIDYEYRANMWVIILQLVLLI